MNRSGRAVSTTLKAGLILLLLLGCAALVTFFLTASPAGATLFTAITPTQENLWSYSDFPKPTYTATNPPTETPLAPPTIAITETPNVLAMELVANAPISVAQEPEQASSAPYVTSGSKYILVDISDQHMYVYENNSVIYSFVASTGINNATRAGTFAVQSKIPNAYGATWNIWMPNWLGIYWAGGLENGIHALPILPNGATLWEGFLGRPVSYGCVVLGTYESKLLYDWAEMGTTVEIQW
jgi:lipoprotein-anchoring transpeptidase ErfK/SrfK